MPTINQLIRNGRKAIAAKPTAPILQKCPQKRGVVSVIFKIISSNPFVISSRPPYRYNRVCPFRGFLGCVLLRPLENRGCMALVFPPAGSDMAG